MEMEMSYHGRESATATSLSFRREEKRREERTLKEEMGKPR